MSESCYNDIFENIKSNLVPKLQYEKSQLEINHLKSELKNSQEELKQMIAKYKEEKLINDIIQSEKESLEAEKEKLEAEKKIFELKLNEFSLKLKLKTNQCDSLLGKTSIGTQIVKQEPQDIGIVNVPTSTSEIGTKRTSSVSADDQRKKAKRKKIIRKSTKNDRKICVSQLFTCEECIDIWGEKIEEDFDGDPDREGAPDPRQSITAFSSFEALLNHEKDVHFDEDEEELFWWKKRCNEKSCLQREGHSKPTSKYNGWYWDSGGRTCAPHGKNICRICDLSFKFKKHLDQHVATGHANHDMTNKQFYDVYLKYKGSSYMVTNRK